MKKITFYLFTLLLSSLSFGQTITLIDAPASGSDIIADPEYSVSPSIDFEVTNFNMPSEGSLEWSLKIDSNGTTVDSGNTTNSSGEIILPALNNGTKYVFTAELVDSNSNSLNPVALYSFKVTFAEYIDVLNLTELISNNTNPDVYYRVTGEVIGTYSIDIPNVAQFFFFQDDTAGIRVFDPDYSQGTFYTNGDAISNIRGRLITNDGGEKEFVPSDVEWGAPTSTGSTPSIPTVTITDITGNVPTYENRLVKINNVTFAPDSFQLDAQLDITDASGTMKFRSAFPTADYLGDNTPTGAQDLTAIVMNLDNSLPTVTARYSLDFSPTLSANNFDLKNSFSIYPNPTELGYVNISKKNDSDVSVKIYNALGKNVLEQTLPSSQSQLNVSRLSSGIYILKLTQNNTSTIKRLVIQ
ncbi:T9SS type A sorting domain-containing protein [Pseudotamlana carrageenivorans]|uniref:Secretion system C-terminal sorting domain-containing protein n=1 Tax=Pseudotamlana carrageenivorans TaxID=2069432 RepID=A0A2I7SIB6_9FLAO|nr:T9SS type A sorting domain-containing protein [Tamlana carrageenivorans]AUS05652.1 hypothetical protein C1A40_09325 [Tamlana carrageenivorans]